MQGVRAQERPVVHTFPEECVDALVALGFSREAWAGDTRIEFLNIVIGRSFLSVSESRRLDSSAH